MVRLQLDFLNNEGNLHKYVVNAIDVMGLITKFGNDWESLRLDKWFPLSGKAQRSLYWDIIKLFRFKGLKNITETVKIEDGILTVTFNGCEAAESEVS